MQAIILAAGSGKRMGCCDIPKVMFKLNDIPLIQHCINNLQEAGINKTIVVVGYKKEAVMEFLGDKVDYAFQEQQLGTGHAVQCAKDKISHSSVLVCCGDMPLFHPSTIKKLMQEFKKQNPKIALLSVNFSDPMPWVYGRIVRDEKGQVKSIVEQKDCNPEQLSIKECNCGFYLFDTEWLKQNLEQLNTDNVQQEYYLTDMVKLAQEQHQKVIAIPVSDECEALGVNTPEQLKMTEECMRKIN